MENLDTYFLKNWRAVNEVRRISSDGEYAFSSESSFYIQVRLFVEPDTPAASLRCIVKWKTQDAFTLINLPNIEENVWTIETQPYLPFQGDFNLTITGTDPLTAYVMVSFIRIQSRQERILTAGM